MPQMRQVINNLNERYGELRGLEKRSDDLLKQVIDRFYIVEGLNRLQTELDCLDLLVKNKANTSSHKVSNDFDMEIIAKDDTKCNTKLYFFKTFFQRSKKATQSAFSLIKSPLKRVFSGTDIETADLRKITRLQRCKLSELMKTVRSTIVTNYGILEQLQHLYEMHDKNMALWDNIRHLAVNVMPNEIELVQEDDVQNQIQNEILAAAAGTTTTTAPTTKTTTLTTKSKKEITAITEISNDIIKTATVVKCDEQIVVDCQAKAPSDNSNEHLNAKDIEITIGDCQTVMNPNVMTQTFSETKPTDAVNAAAAVACDPATQLDSTKNARLLKKNMKTTISKAN